MDVKGEIAAADVAVLSKAPGRAGMTVTIGVLAATVLYCGSQALEKSYFPAFFCSPFLVATIVGLISVERPIRNALYTLFAALALAVLSLREGVVCCLMSLPLAVPEVVLGAICGRTIRRFVHARKVRRAIGIALVALGLGWQAIEGAVDDPARHPLHVAESAVVIPAAPERVFAALAARDLQVAPEWPWFLRVGLPMPVRWSLESARVGGRVTATFSQGVATGHVTSWEPGRSFSYVIDRYDITDLPFHITRLGRGPAYGLRAERVDDWLSIVSTRYDLAATPDGGTELRRQVVWRRHLAPAFYFAWLQQTVMQRGQDRLLALVCRRIVETRGSGDGGPVVVVAAVTRR